MRYHGAMRPSILLLLTCASLVPLAAAEGVAYQFNLRATWADTYLHDLGADRTGGGGGFAVLLGQAPLRLRVRMDGDTFPVPAGTGAVQTFGLGAEAFLLLPLGDRVRPFLAAGPAFQQWALTGKETTQKLAVRAEAGIWVKEKVGICAGVLTGATRPGRTDTLSYLQVNFNF